MPLYQFMCGNCGKVEERLQPFGDNAPFCCGKFMERKMSVSNSTFGWRLTEASHLPGNKDELERNI